jgi:ribulose-5-phosphate 4-epimerase/fuculose-1-phosphate aldolase/putative sterol carrier protein
MHNHKKDLIDVGRLIWEKDLTGGMSGNISVKISPAKVLITGRGTCLGMLEDQDVGIVDLDGNPLEKDFYPSSEIPFHTSVYKNLGVQAIIHVHPTFSNGYFAANDRIEFDTFETRLTLGEIPVIDQKTPTITEIGPVIEALKKSNIIVLKHHGVVAIGEMLKDAFFLIQTLEEAVKIACIRDLYGRQASKAESCMSPMPGTSGKKYKIFSQEQIEAIVSLVNTDVQFKKLATETALETKLAVVQDETQTVYCFHFSEGGIKSFSTSITDAEFVISGKSEYWRSIFNRQLDPFAATTQKKLKLKGDFAKISRWYVPFNRLFELWTGVPAE